MACDRPSCAEAAWAACHGELRAWLVHHLRDDSLADDLLQEVAVKALRQGPAFCRVEQPRAWLFQVARHALVDALRRTRPEVPLPDDLTLPETDEDGHAPVDALAGCVVRVLQELALQDAQILRACDLEGQTVRAFANAQGLGLPAAKSRLLRARQRLRARLTDACRVQFDPEGRVSGHTPRG